MLRNGTNRALCAIRRYYSSDCDCYSFVTKEMERYLQCRKDTKLDMCIIDENMVDPCWDQPEIIVIGAGIAGLSAAQRLAGSGLVKIKVIEATHRGRIHSSWFGNVPVELGAPFIEGGSLSNSVYTLASQESLISKPPLKEDPFASLCVTSDGRLIPAYISQAAIESFFGIIQSATELYIAAKDYKDCGRLRTFICKQMEHELEAFPHRYRDFASRVMMSEALLLRNKIGSALIDVSAKDFGSYAELSGGRVRVASGMIGVLASLLRAMPECDTITYCKPVTKIIWTAKDEYEDEKKTIKKPRVRVVCCDGRSYKADYCVITLPLGVLKKHMDSMFLPVLPKSKENAIKRLGYGHINHVYFEYNHPFWVWNEGSLRPCWRFDEIKDDGYWLKGIGLIDEVPTSQQILSVTVSDAAAKCVEELSEIKLAEDFTRFLRQLLNNPTLPYPANVMKTKWSSCPFSLGAKTYIKYGANVGDICDLGRTVPDECDPETPVLFFAGEAAALGAYGTMHGARMSGIKAAEQIINYTKKFQGKPVEKHEESVCTKAEAAV
uniref:Putative flavin-containing amine oxidase n=1 Tax=Rhodnius prolixus TaxID=13249 RepID=R4G3A0_RHOPR